MEQLPADEETMGMAEAGGRGAWRESTPAERVAGFLLPALFTGRLQ
jgi:hypothetical protein